MRKKEKKYIGKLTRVIIDEIKENMIKDKVVKVEDKHVAQIFQRLVNTDADFCKRMELSTRKDLAEFMSFTNKVYVEGKTIGTYSKEGFTDKKPVYLKVYFPSSYDSSIILKSQAYYDKFEKLSKTRLTIRALFDNELKIFVGKSLNNFFIQFPELEQYFKYVEPLPAMKGDRQLIPVKTMNEIKNKISSILED